MNHDDVNGFNCVSCGRALEERDEFFPLPCEHVLHPNCPPLGRCPVDGQILQISTLQSFAFSTDFAEVDRFERLMGTDYLSSSCRNIGWIYKHERHGQNGDTEAVQWFRRALDYDSTNANALLDLAECYEDGFGVTRNLQKAAELRQQVEPHLRAGDISLVTLTAQEEPTSESAGTSESPGQIFLGEACCENTAKVTSVLAPNPDIEGLPESVNEAPDSVPQPMTTSSKQESPSTQDAEESPQVPRDELSQTQTVGTAPPESQLARETATATMSTINQISEIQEAEFESVQDPSLESSFDKVASSPLTAGKQVSSQQSGMIGTISGSEDEAEKQSVSSMARSCISCKRLVKEGNDLRLLPCEHIVHAHCLKIPSGRCPVDDQILDLPGIQSEEAVPFNSEYMSISRMDRLMFSTDYSPHSCRNVGWMLKHEMEGGSHSVKCAEWFQKALALDPNNPSALLDLANCYDEGLGVRHNPIKANELRERAKPFVDAVDARNMELLGISTTAARNCAALARPVEDHQSDIDRNSKIQQQALTNPATSQKPLAKATIDCEPDKGGTQPLTVLELPCNRVPVAHCKETEDSQAVLDGTSEEHDRAKEVTTNSGTGTSVHSVECKTKTSLVPDQEQDVDITYAQEESSTEHCQYSPKSSQSDPNQGSSSAECFVPGHPTHDNSNSRENLGALAGQDIVPSSKTSNVHPLDQPEQALEDSDNDISDVRIELGNLDAPKLSGIFLRALPYVLRLHPTLNKRLFTESGFTAFRERAASAADNETKPCKYPIHYPLPLQAPNPRHNDIDELFGLLACDKEYGTTTLEGRHYRPTIRDYFGAYKTKVLTPRIVVNVLLDMIRRSNQGDGKLNAVIRTQRSDALAQAKLSTSRWHRGAPLSILDGVPFTVTDSLDAEGYPSGCTSLFIRKGEEQLQPKDCKVVCALKKAGMILVGKCNEDELAAGTKGFSTAIGQTLNPHNSNHISGGSSGGCAAAVAAGLCPVSLGCTSGGGVRIPAACCGVFGLKATFSRIATQGKSLTPRNAGDDHTSSLLHIGPITGCAEDLAIIYFTLAKFAPHGRILSTTPYVSPNAFIPATLKPGVSGLRVGFYKGWSEGISQNALRSFAIGRRRMQSQGAILVPVSIPNLEDIRVAHAATVISDLLNVVRRVSQQGRAAESQIGPEARCKLAIAKLISKEDIARADIVRAKAMSHCVQDLFGTANLDVLITPAIGSDVPEAPENERTGVLNVSMESKLMQFSAYANFIGIPACVFPVMRDERSGLPYGMQAMTAPWNEWKLIRTCLWAEREFPPKQLLAASKSFNPLDSSGGSLHQQK